MKQSQSKHSIMGNRAYRRTKSQQREINKVVDKVISNNKNNLQKLKQSLESSTNNNINKDFSTGQNTNVVVHNVNDNSMKTTAIANASMLHFIDVANHQLDRKGDNLTKSDLLAIVLCLEPSSDVNALNKLTVSDLNTMIRNIVYDPVRCEQRFHQLHVSAINNSANPVSKIVD